MYDFATYFAWFVLALLFLIAVAFIVWLGSLPKKIATRRNHPQADAINVCSWIGLAAGGAGWVIALIWAYTVPLNVNVGTPGNKSSGEMEPEGTEEATSKELGGDLASRTAS